MKKTFLMLISTISINAQITQRRLKHNVNYATHAAPLITAVMNTHGSIFELGVGDFSTPFLHAICKATNRFLLSAETDKNWLQLFMDLERPWHKLVHVDKGFLGEGWDTIGNNHEWSVVFIDHAPGERRITDIERLRPITEVFVIHDTEATCYGYEPLLSSFKYRYVYKRYLPETTLVSDTINVTTFFDKE